MNKLNRILIVLLVAQLIVSAFVFLPSTLNTSSAETAPLLGETQTTGIVGVTITDGEGATVRLARRDSGWVLPDAGDYPAQEDLVQPFLEKLVALKTDRVVTETSSSHKRLKVADDTFERKIELALADGSQVLFYVGSSPSYGASHFRPDGESKVYLTSEVSATDARAAAASWIDRIYFSAPREQVVALTLENASGRFEFSKEGETWTMAGLAEGETFDDAGFGTLLSRVASVTMTAPLGKEVKPEYGLSTPTAVVTVQTKAEDGTAKTMTLTVGAQDPEDKSYVIQSSESPYVVRVSEYAVDMLVQKDRAGLMVQPTPVPEATPAG